jgi:hypothetical protein
MKMREKKACVTSCTEFAAYYKVRTDSKNWTPYQKVSNLISLP